MDEDEEVLSQAKGMFHILRYRLDCFTNNPCHEAARDVINYAEAVKEDMQTYLKETTK